MKEWLRRSLSEAVYGGTRRWAQDWQVTSRAAIVFAPHADDETFGCGGLIALKVAAGIPIRVVVLTDGASAADGCPRRRQAITGIREQEAMRAGALLGLAPERMSFLRLPDGKLGDLEARDRSDALDRIGALLRQDRPGEVFVTHRRDRHPDHVAAFRLVVEALHAVQHPARLFQYPIWLAWWSGLGLRMRPSDLSGALRLAIDGVADRKAAAIACYPSQLVVLPKGFVRHFHSPWELFFEHHRSPR